MGVFGSGIGPLEAKSLLNLSLIRKFPPPPGRPVTPGRQDPARAGLAVPLGQAGRPLPPRVDMGMACDQAGGRLSGHPAASPSGVTERDFPRGTTFDTALTGLDTALTERDDFCKLHFFGMHRLKEFGPVWPEFDHEENRSWTNY
jgi:hypothetical protein